MRFALAFIVGLTLPLIIINTGHAEEETKHFTLWANPKESHKVTYLEFYSRSRRSLFGLCDNAILLVGRDNASSSTYVPYVMDEKKVVFASHDGLFIIPQGVDLSMELLLCGQSGLANFSLCSFFKEGL